MVIIIMLKLVYMIDVTTFNRSWVIRIKRTIKLYNTCQVKLVIGGNIILIIEQVGYSQPKSIIVINWHKLWVNLNHRWCNKPIISTMPCVTQ